MCQSIPRVQMRFLARFMFIFKLGTAQNTTASPFLFHQSLQKILLRLKNRDSFLSGTQLLNFAIPEFLPPECYENDFLC